MAEVLLSMNEKGFENPEFLQAIHLLHKKFDLVSITGKKPVEPAHCEKVQAWVVAGGDGTLNHVVNALMRLPAEKRPPLCYLPSGTGNDFARTLGLDLAPPLELLEEAFSSGARYRSLAVGLCNEQYFLNMASGGIFAEVTPETNDKLKSLMGSWSYFFQGLGKMLDRKSIALTVDGGGSESALGFFVGNARFAGGGIQITSDANPFHPSLEFLLVPDLPTKDLLALGLQLQNENPDLSGFPVRFRKVTALSLAFGEKVSINLDGEQIQVRDAKFSVEPAALRIFTPGRVSG